MPSFKLAHLLRPDVSVRRFAQSSQRIKPRGVLGTTGTNDLPLGTDEFWPHLALMRRVALETDGVPDSYGLITSPWLESELTRLPAYANGSISNWASIDYGKQVSNQITDHRIFTGLWAYLVIATFGPGIDLIVDTFTQSHTGRVIITANIFCDTVVRFPQAFSYTEPMAPPLRSRTGADAIPPEPKVRIEEPILPATTPAQAPGPAALHSEATKPVEPEERGGKGKNWKAPFR